MLKVNMGGPFPENGFPERCWVWTGSTDKFGYGRFKIGTTNHQAHRWFAQFLAQRPLRWDAESRETVNHRCDRTLCVRPGHLYIADQKANVADARMGGEHISIRRRKESEARDQCVNGHLFTPDNTYRAKSGTRVCRTCQRVASQRYRERKQREQIRLAQ